MSDPVTADDVKGIFKDYETLIPVDMTEKQIRHVHAWLRASSVEVRSSDPAMEAAWWTTPVGEFCKTLEELVQNDRHAGSAA